MKKMIMALAVCLGIAACAAVDVDAQQLTFSTTTITLASSISTTTQTGWLVLNTQPRAKVVKLEVNWIPNTSTATLVFYDGLRGSTTTARALLTVLIPSSATAAGSWEKEFSYTFSAPLTCNYGLTVVQTAGLKAAGEIAVNALWW